MAAKLVSRTKYKFQSRSHSKSSDYTRKEHWTWSTKMAGKLVSRTKYKFQSRSHSKSSDYTRKEHWTWSTKMAGKLVSRTKYKFQSRSHSKSNMTTPAKNTGPGVPIDGGEWLQNLMGWITVMRYLGQCGAVIWLTIHTMFQSKKDLQQE